MDFPEEPAPTWDGMLDRIEMALRDRAPYSPLYVMGPTPSPARRHAIAEVIREAFAPQLKRAEDDSEILYRLRKLAHANRFNDTIPTRTLQALLYGEELKR